MKIINKAVLLFKVPPSNNEDDFYEVMLVKENFNVKQVKTLDFEYKNLDTLKTKLKSPDEYSGIIFSSPRCVFGTKNALCDEKLDAKWKGKSNYVVGSTTHETAIKCLGIDCLGKESGNANNLAVIIIKGKLHYCSTMHQDQIVKNMHTFNLLQYLFVESQKTEGNCTFLYPHGNLKLDILKNQLEPEGITLDEVCVYDSITNPNIEKEFQKVTENLLEIPEFMVFFSPSAVKGILSTIKQLPDDIINNIKVCINATKQKKN